MKVTQNSWHQRAIIRWQPTTKWHTRLVILHVARHVWLSLVIHYICKKVLCRTWGTCNTISNKRTHTYAQKNKQTENLPANMSSETSGLTCRHVKRGRGLWAWFIFSWMLLSLMSIRWEERTQTLNHLQSLTARSRWLISWPSSRLHGSKMNKARGWNRTRWKKRG